MTGQRRRVGSLGGGLPAAVFAVFAAFMPAPAAAQVGATPDTSTPEATTVAFVSFMRASDWDGMAGLMHPEALDELRQLFVPILDAEGMEGLREEMFGADAAADVSSTTGSEIYAKLISLALGADPSAAAALGTMRADPVGHVMEGDTAHVVYHLNMTVEGIDLNQTAVASFIQLDSRWLGILTADLRGMIAGMQQAIEAGQ